METDRQDELRREARERADRRDAFLTELFDTADFMERVVPSKPVDQDALLEEYLAQLRNNVRYAMTLAINDSSAAKTNLHGANTVARLINTSLAVTRTMRDADNRRKKSKTVRGGRVEKATQD